MGLWAGGAELLLPSHPHEAEFARNLVIAGNPRSNFNNSKTIRFLCSPPTSQANCNAYTTLLEMILQRGATDT